MKAIKDTITANINEARSKKSLNDVDFIMTYADFKKWIEKQKKGYVFATWAQVDPDYPISDLLSDDNQRLFVWFNPDAKKWQGFEDEDQVDEDGIDVDKWTLTDTDIIFVEKLY